MGTPTADNCSHATDMLQIFTDSQHICSFGKGKITQTSNKIRSLHFTNSQYKAFIVKVKKKN